MKENIKQNWIIISLLLISSLYISFYIQKFYTFPFDDAYIHMRIARNLAFHGVPYFNIDEKLMASSTHLWIIMLALIFRLAGPEPHHVVFLEIFFTISSLISLYFLLRKRFSNLTATLASIFLILAFLLNISSGLMETPAFILFFVLALLSLANKKYFWAGLFAAFSIWVRYESVILAGLIFLFLSNKDKIKYLKGFFPLFLLFVAFNFYYFGTIIPQPLMAKPVVYKLSWSSFFGFLFNRWLPSTTPLQIFGILFFLAFLFSSTIYFWKRTKGEEFIWIRICLLFGLILGTLHAVRCSLVFWWYWPMFWIPLLIAHFSFWKKEKILITFALTLFLYSYPIRSIKDFYAYFSGQYQYNQYAVLGFRVPQYLKAGESLSLKYPHGTLMTSEVGALGWSYSGKIIDGAALITAATLKYHPMKVPEERYSGEFASVPPQAVNDYNPDAVVSIPAFATAFRRDFSKQKFPLYELSTRWPVVPPEVTKITGVSKIWSCPIIEVYTKIKN